MARARKKIGLLERGKGLIGFSLVVAAIAGFLFVFGSLAWQGGKAWLDWRAFEQQSVSATGTVIGRYIETCAYGPCKRYPPNWGVQVRSPDLAGSQQFDKDFCISRKADGSRRTRRYRGPGPCVHVIVTRFSLKGTEQVHHEVTFPRYYFESWDKTDMPLLVDPANPYDARHADNRYSREAFDLATYVFLFVGAYALFEWIKSRTWTPWRKTVIKREKDRERRRLAKLKRQALG
jgi:hypothetical protein